MKQARHIEPMSRVMIRIPMRLRKKLEKLADLRSVAVNTVISELLEYALRGQDGQDASDWMK